MIANMKKNIACCPPIFGYPLQQMLSFKSIFSLQYVFNSIYKRYVDKKALNITSSTLNIIIKQSSKTFQLKSYHVYQIV